MPADVNVIVRSVLKGELHFCLQFGGSDLFLDGNGLIVVVHFGGVHLLIFDVELRLRIACASDGEGMCGEAVAVVNLLGLDLRTTPQIATVVMPA